MPLAFSLSHSSIHSLHIYAFLTITLLFHHHLIPLLLLSDLSTTILFCFICLHCHLPLRPSFFASCSPLTFSHLSLSGMQLFSAPESRMNGSDCIIIRMIAFQPLSRNLLRLVMLIVFHLVPHRCRQRGESSFQILSPLIFIR